MEDCGFGIWFFLSFFLKHMDLKKILRLQFWVSLIFRLKVARPSIFIGTPSIFESLILKQIYLYCKTIMILW